MPISSCLACLQDLHRQASQGMCTASWWKDLRGGVKKEIRALIEYKDAILQV